MVLISSQWDQEFLSYGHLKNDRCGKKERFSNIWGYLFDLESLESTVRADFLMRLYTPGTRNSDGLYFISIGPGVPELWTFKKRSLHLAKCTLPLPSHLPEPQYSPTRPSDGFSNGCNSGTPGPIEMK